MHGPVLRFLFSFLFLIAALLPDVSAQPGSTGAEAAYRDGLQLFERGQYATARFRFREAMDQAEDARSVLYGNARYHEAICALELNHTDAPRLAESFVQDLPAHPGATTLTLRTGRYFFDRKEYSLCKSWLEKLQPGNVPAQERDRYYFLMGYSLFSLNDMANARGYFADVRYEDPQYGAPALYYYAHILFTEQKYDAALPGFLRLRDQPSYKGLVASYIVQIWFVQEKFRQVADEGPAMLNGIASDKRAEVLGLIGNAHFRLAEYARALEYLSGSVDGREPSAEEHYRLGYCLYQLQRFDQAVGHFRGVLPAGGALAQNASFHMADCYLRLGEKALAREAFATSGSTPAGTASAASARQMAEALYNEAVLTYELKDKPLPEIIGRFTSFLERFPQSAQVKDAWGYLALLYHESRNYQMALDALQRGPMEQDRMKAAFQRSAYFRALELIEAQQYEPALGLLDRSLEYAAMDPDLGNRCYYLKGEAYYGLGLNTQAIAMYRRFLTAPSALTLEEYPAAMYGLGYVYFRLKDYPEARTWFSRFISLGRESAGRKVSDAQCRMGDTYFMEAQYASAVQWYQKVAVLNAPPADYALFQMGFAQGLLNDHLSRIRTLAGLMSRFPASEYTDDAWYETGRSYIALNDRKQAIDAFRKVTDNYPDSDYRARALQQLGLVYYNMDEAEQSLSFYSLVVREYPGTEDVRNALTGIRTIFVDRNAPEEYVDYIASLGAGTMVRRGEQDSLLFQVAENLFTKERYQDASVRLGTYLERFPEGNFTQKAHFYLAECLVRLDHQEESLLHYAEASRSMGTSFREAALKASAAILFQRQRYDEAEGYFEALADESTDASVVHGARLGVLRCLYLKKDYQGVVREAGVLPDSRLLQPAETTEVKRMLSDAYLQLGQLPEALAGYQGLSSEVRTETGAEARYRVADILFRQGKLDEAQKVVFDFGEQKSPQLFWMAKSYLVLSDVYAARQDTFMLRQTLQSLLDNYQKTDDGILDEARAKLGKIKP